MLSAFSRTVFKSSVPNSLRAFSTQSITEALKEVIPEKREQVKRLRTEHGDKVLGNCTVTQAIGGARGVKCMIWDASLLDAQEGIEFRDLSIPQVQEQLPSVTGVPGEGEPTPEALLWLLLTGKIPTGEQAQSLGKELEARSQLDDHVVEAIANFPHQTMHPMTQLSTALLHMQTNSKFHQAYQTGTASKDTYWEYTLEDSLDLIAKISRVAALIYRHTFHPSDVNVDRILATDSSLDYSANFCRWLGFDDAEFDELMRLYIVIHSDHEGGNASAHTTHLVASTLADPYLSYASGLCALAGPLHGLANQEVLKWIMNLKAKFDAEGKEVNEETITQFAWDTLNNKQVIPGFGHAVLRQTDPRYTCQRDFALRNSAHTSPLFSIVDNCFKVMPKVLTEHGKTANPYPNVDAHSGMLLTHYGLHEMEYYTVLFGVSRAFGALTQVVWDRALGLPLERPKSMTLDSIEKFCNGN